MRSAVHWLTHFLSGAFSLSSSPTQSRRRCRIPSPHEEYSGNKQWDQVDQCHLVMTQFTPRWHDSVSCRLPHLPELPSTAGRSTSRYRDLLPPTRQSWKVHTNYSIQEINVQFQVVFALLTEYHVNKLAQNF